MTVARPFTIHFTVASNVLGGPENFFFLFDLTYLEQDAVANNQPVQKKIYI